MPDEDFTADIPNEYLCGIGRVAVSWNYLESLLHHTLILALLSDVSSDFRALAIFAHMAFPQKLDSLSSMLNILYGEDGEIFTAYREQVQPLLKQCQEKRNAVLHQTWYDQSGTVHRFDVKARGALKITLFPVTLQELADVSALIMVAHSKLLNLICVPLVPTKKPQEGQ